ncbi:MAG TPA: hypothetical protein VFU64_00915 [Gaiellaceae bacterium]|nr:hypothetical protein [Gaiellaceae bacterium]
MTDHSLNRLRAANPFPATTAADADALFDRIVLTPPDSRLARTPRRYRRPVLVLVTAVLACGLLASAAYAISGWLGGHIITGPTVKAEYVAAQKQLTMPPGYSWPPFRWPPDSVTSRGAGGSMAVNLDQGAWECYWVGAIHSHDLAAQRRARAALDDLLTNHAVIAPAGAPEDYTPPQSARTPTMVFADDGGYQYNQRKYAEAAAGHPQLLEQSCRANGPGPHG